MLGFLAALVAGFLTPHAEEPLARPVARALKGHVELAPGELRLLAFILALLIGAVVAELLDSGSPFWVVLGGGLGYFATRLTAAARRAIDTRRA